MTGARTQRELRRHGRRGSLRLSAYPARSTLGRCCWLLLWLPLVWLPALTRAETPVDELGRSMETLRGGWYLWDPYQFMEPGNDDRELTGLDIDITRAVAREAGFTVDLPYRPWADHVAALRAGTADIASGGSWSEDRIPFIRFSQPYRQAVNVLYLPTGRAEQMPFTTVDEMLTTFSRRGFKLGAIAGFNYTDPRINAWIADPTNAGRVILVANDYENFRNLAEGRINGFLADRLASAAVALRGGWQDKVEEHPLQLVSNIHFMFSRATVPAETVARFDAAIARLQASGELQRIRARYTTPILLAHTVDSAWFTAFDIVGTVAFALSGVLIAARERYSLFGALLLAVLPAVGGGIMRDLLVGRTPPVALTSTLPISLIAGTVFAGFVVFRLWRYEDLHQHRLPGLWAQSARNVMRNLLEISDAVGIAAFTVTGVGVALARHTEPLWLWGPLLAVMTAAGGGILRDIVRQAGQIPSLRDAFYAEVPLLWGFAFSLFLIWQIPGEIKPEVFGIGVIATMVGAFATRMTVVWLKLKSPSFT